MIELFGEIDHQETNNHENKQHVVALKPFIKLCPNLSESFLPSPSSFAVMFAFPPSKPTSVAAIVCIRVLAAVACLCAAAIMMSSHEKTEVFGIELNARFDDTPAFKFLAIVTMVVFVYSLVTIFIRQTSSTIDLLLAMDVAAMMGLVASVSACGFVGYYGSHGSPKAGWMPVCDRVPRFCKRTTVSLGCNSAAFLLYVIIVFYSILKNHHNNS